MPKITKDCPHGWREPGDAWFLLKQHEPTKRTRQCRLCKITRLETFEHGYWRGIRQASLPFDVPYKPPAWQQDFEAPILREDWDWSQ